MNPSQAVVQGTLNADGTLELDEKPNLPPGKVRVVLSVAPMPVQDRESVWTVLENIRAEREALGMKSRTREEIDTEINALRQEWENRMTELDRIRQGGREAREG